MKSAGHGKAKIISPTELELLFERGSFSIRDRALFAICLFTGCRISEALTLRTEDINMSMITFRKGSTKGKIATRQIAVSPGLWKVLAIYKPCRDNGYFFPGKLGERETLSRDAADKNLRDACKRSGLKGISTHSFRRTALTMMANAGVPLRHIQEVSGHKDLNSLQRYLEVTDHDMIKAIGSIKF